MLAGLIAPRLRLGFVSPLPQLRLGYASTTHRLRLDYALASISCEHCRSSRNNPHYAPRHIIYYYITQPHKKNGLELEMRPIISYRFCRTDDEYEGHFIVFSNYLIFCN